MLKFPNTLSPRPYDKVPCFPNTLNPNMFNFLKTLNLILNVKVPTDQEIQ